MDHVAPDENVCMFNFLNSHCSNNRGNRDNAPNALVWLRVEWARPPSRKTLTWPRVYGLC